MEANKAAKLAKVRERLKNGELKTRKKEGSKSAAWEKFSEVVRADDDSSAGYVVCNGCETLYVFDSHKTGTSNMVHHQCAGTAGSAKPAAMQSTLKSYVVRRDSKDKVLVPLDVKSMFAPDDCYSSSSEIPGQPEQWCEASQTSGQPEQLCKQDKCKDRAKTYQKIHTTAQITDEAFLLLEKLQALGVRPILLISRPGTKPGSWVSELLSPRCQLTKTSAACLKRIQDLFDIVIQAEPPYEPDLRSGENADSSVNIE